VVAWGAVVAVESPQAANSVDNTIRTTVKAACGLLSDKCFVISNCPPPGISRFLSKTMGLWLNQKKKITVLELLYQQLIKAHLLMVGKTN
jgi:hypothetical protein